MKLVNFFHEGAVRTGLLGSNGVVDLATADLWQGSAPVKIDDIEALRSKINLASLPARSLDSLHLAPPVIAPEKIICVGLNYRRHALEVGRCLEPALTHEDAIRRHVRPVGNRWLRDADLARQRADTAGRADRFIKAHISHKAISRQRNFLER